jgi:hypothetical protein
MHPFHRSRSILAALSLALLATAGPAYARGPRIASVRPVPDRPYLAVDVEYPRDALPPEPSFTFEADGRPAPARAAGGGSDPQTITATYLVFPGAACRQLVARWGPGPKERTAPASPRWKAPALALLLDRLGDREALLAPADLEVQVFPPATARLLQDGSPLPATRVEAPGPGERLRVSPRWQPGLNTIRLVVEGPAGRSERTFTFVLVQDGGLAPGDSARLVYGEVGSRSGPFYRLAVEGDALALATDGLGEVARAAGDGWIAGAQVHVATLQARAAGEATLRIARKASFLDGEYEPRSEHRLRVGEPAAPAPARGGGKPEKLLGLHADADRGQLAFEVWTGGCTEKRSFRVERTGTELTLFRLERDGCKMVPQAATITFGLDELGLKRDQPFTVRNAFVADPETAALP